MTKSRRRQQDEANDAYRAQQRRIAAGTIGDRYPNVTGITTTFDFAAYGAGLAAAETKTWPTRRPQHSALFVYPCRMRDCSDGGYDLDDEINAMLAEGVERIEGDATCPGHIDTRYRCGDRIHYEVRAEYL